jgi:hypothetical protein
MLARCGRGVQALGVSRDYAYQFARGERIPHRRHWLKLAELAGVMSANA